MKVVYFDNPLIRSISDSPEKWDASYDQFVKIFGRSFIPLQSYYSFFEYIGFARKNLELPSFFTTPYLDHAEKLISQKKATKYIDLLDKNLLEIEHGLKFYIKQKLFTLKPTLNRLIEEREKRISSFKGSQEFINALFGNIFSSIENDFGEFVHVATTYLTWDIFCSINPQDLPVKVLRERQLGIWLQNWEKGLKLPFGKIIDDQSNYYKMQFSSQLKNYEDMVDSEMLTYLILGAEIYGKLQKVHCITYPPKNKSALSQRNELALGTVSNIEASLKRKISKNTGKIYILDETENQVQEILEPMFPIFI